MNIFLISGKSRMLIQEEIDAIIKNETNIITCNYNDIDIDYILEEAAYLSLFDEKKYLIIKNATLFSGKKTTEEETNKLIKYFENPNLNTILIFSLNDKIDERKKITKFIRKNYQVIVIADLSKNQIINKFKTIFKKEQINIETSSIEKIIDSCLNDYDLIYNEVQKLITFALDTKEITDLDVEKLIAKNIDENVFKFSDAVMKKEHKKMFELFNDLKIIKEEPIVLLNNLAREYRLMYKCIVLHNRGWNKAKIAKKIEIADWLVDKSLRNSYNYRSDNILDNLRKLAKLDLDIKSGKIDKYLGIELFMLDL